MTKFFVGLYNYFERHKVLFYLSLSVCILFMALFAAQVRFEEKRNQFLSGYQGLPKTPSTYLKI